MTIKKNVIMEFIQIGENELTVFDPQTGDTHFLDETGSVILSCLDTATPIEELIQKLSAKYQAEPGIIEADVKEFVNDLLEKEIVVSE